MAPLSTSMREDQPQSMAAPDAQGPAVVNVRRPAPARVEPATPSKPLPERSGLDDVPLPPTALRLPDLALAVKRGRKLRITPGVVVQWTMLALGALVALWLIFGGRLPALRSAEDASDWAPPGITSDNSLPPPWSGSSSLQSTASEWDAPVWQAPAEDAPDVSSAAFPEGAAPAGSIPDPYGSAPYDYDAHESDPYEQDVYPAHPYDEPPPAEAPNDWSTSVQYPPAAPAASGGDAVRTARRDDSPDGRGANSSSPPPSEAPPLGITVPVPQ